MHKEWITTKCVSLQCLFFLEINNGTLQPSISTLLFSASTSLAVTPSSIGTLSTIVKPTETITLGKMDCIYIVLLTIYIYIYSP